MEKVKELYIIRHGETDYNLKKIVQGSGVDSSLNENGRQQAAAFYKNYQNEGFDKVYTSALKRTKESVAQFIGDGIPYEALVGLNEISWGAREGNPFTPEENKYYYSVLARWQNGETNLPVEGGESPEEVALRQKEALRHIMAQEDETRVLVCMHGRAMRILLTQLFNYPISNMDVFLHQNLGLYKIKATKNQFQLLSYNERDF
ncbi:MAG: broad specificity phosphatase PhoE [Marivirga sp.]|jgi:broad specificity phosphatase PhoE